MDAMLVNLVEACERGHDYPQRIWLVTNAGHFVTGEPASAQRLREETLRCLTGETRKALAKRPRRERKADPGDPDLLARETLASLGDGTTGSPVLNLVPAQLREVAGGGGVHIPSFRIPVGAVTAWWLAGEKEIKASQGWNPWAGGPVPINK